MSNESTRRLTNKVRAVAALAESLADDLQQGKLWEGDATQMLSAIQNELREAMNINPDPYRR